MKPLITAEDVWSVPPGGEISAPPGSIVTPWAREIAATRGVRIVSGPARSDGIAVAIGADHGGFALKEEVKTHLTRLGYRFHDVGTFSTEPVDYPDIALAVARAVRAGDARLGILVDGAGIGSAMAANKVPGVRAAPCADEAAARNAREHNDANVLTLGARFVDATRMLGIVETFLTTHCTEERHARRVAKITAIEGTYLKEPRLG
ncbi:MAG TPA: ribose 5-phosphate isomerase B [Vicinamibacteria bacterium]|nr:ribose 5-phosphate isomerase B [Vicinamibacteria bacterium]